MSRGGTVSLDRCIASIRAGVSVSGESRLPKPGEIGILTLSAVSGGRFAPDACKALARSVAPALGGSVRAGTLLMSRSNTADLVGSTALVEEDHPDRYLPDLLWEITVRDDSPLTATFLADYLGTTPGRRLLQSAAMGTSGSMKKLSMTRVRALEVPRVPRELQQAWMRVRRSYNSVLAALGVVIATKRELKRGLLHQLLTGRRRFVEFTGGDVEVVRLGDHASEVSERKRADLGPARVKGVIKGAGLEPMRDHVRAADLSRYKLVRPDDFAYNPMRLNIGSIARSLHVEDCLVSPDYVVFRTDDQTLLPAYLDQLRRSRIWRQFVEPAGSGSVRVRIYFRDIAEMRIPLPSLPEQRRIAETLDTLDREIALLEQLRDTYEAQRRGLMQRLLTGELKAPAAVALEPALADA